MQHRNISRTHHFYFLTAICRPIHKFVAFNGNVGVKGVLRIVRGFRTRIRLDLRSIAIDTGIVTNGYILAFTGFEPLIGIALQQNGRLHQGRSTNPSAVLCLFLCSKKDGED